MGTGLSFVLSETSLEPNFPYATTLFEGFGDFNIFKKCLRDFCFLRILAISTWPHANYWNLGVK